MIRDVKTYFKTVANRLSNAFLVEDFDTERELEFWALSAEHISRKEPPKFTDIVDWIDLLYRAPIHFIYKQGKEDKLHLYRRQVLVENIKNATGVEDDKELTEKQQQQIREYEEQLEHIENRIQWNDEFLNVGMSSHSIGKCEHIPIYDDGEPWGIYCVGPYVTSPDRIKAKLPIVARILSNWLVNLDTTETKPTQSYEAKAEKVVSNLGTGTLNIDRIANLMLGYLAHNKSAAFGGIVEQTSDTIEFLAKYKLEEELIEWIKDNVVFNDSPAQIEEKFHSQQGSPLINEAKYFQINELETENSRAIIFIGFAEEQDSEEKIEGIISETLNNLLTYRSQNLQITDKLIDTYYQMLRQLERKKKRTRYHTPRIVRLVEEFSKEFGLDEDEQQQLVQTARLHDVGYIVTGQLDERMTMGAELEHPFIGSMIVEALPLHKDVKEGIKTHHEWINGSGTPYGLNGEDISWTGKIVGLFEFVNGFVETNQDNDTKTGDEWIETLAEELIERAENQFDMVLVPTAVNLIRSLGWDALCTLGSESNPN